MRRRRQPQSPRAPEPWSPRATDRQSPRAPEPQSLDFCIVPVHLNQVVKVNKQTTPFSHT
eukprot:15806293-Heterocapsa_arctica.AAC.1